MLQAFIIKVVLRMLNSTRVSNEHRQLLTAAVLDKQGAIHLRARIITDDTGKLYVDGRPLTLETAQKLKTSAEGLRNNYARKFVGDQVTYMAIQMGVFQNATPEQGLFAKAALWVRQEEDKLYAMLSQNSEIEEEE